MSALKGRGGRPQVAELSRSSIAAAARKLFRQRGYADTTMEAIAAESGFAVQTVYFHFKSKAAILTRLIDELQAEELAPRYDLAVAATSGGELIRRTVRIARAVHDDGWDLMQVLASAANSDRGLATRLKDTESGRLFGMRSFVHRLAELGALRAALEATTAVDICWALTSLEVYRLLRVDRGWGGDAYQSWLATALDQELCGAPGRATA